MDCPRCGERLDRYRQGDREASSCPGCGWTGVSADHHGETRIPEPWSEALRRFYRGERRTLEAEALAEAATAIDGGRLGDDDRGS
jgi:predicted  nucleic acid-binding Zn-ribbon protein